MKWRFHIRRIGRLILYLLSAVMLVTVILSLALLVTPVREYALGRILVRVDRAVPGLAQVREARWPSPGSIEFVGLNWTDRGDTLVYADTVSLDVRLRSLFARDLRINQLTVVALRADIPTIVEKLSPATPRAVDASSQRGKLPFLRQGALPSLPSLSIGQVRVSGDSVHIANTVVRAFNLIGAAELRRGHAPLLQVERMEMSGTPGTWHVADVSIDIDLAAGQLHGRGRGALAPEWPFYLALTSPSKDRFSLAVTRDEHARPPDAVGVSVEGTVHRKGFDVRGLSFDAWLRTPGSHELPLVTPDKLKGLRPLEGIAVALEGAVQLNPALTVRATAEVGRNPWLDRAHIALSIDPETVQLDTLIVRLPDVAIAASGVSVGDSIAAQAVLHITGDAWMQKLLVKPPALDTLFVHGVAGASGALRSPRVVAQIRAAAGNDGAVLDDLQLRAEIPGDSERPSTVDIAARAVELTAHTRAEISTGEEFTIRLAPIDVRRASQKSSPVKLGAERSVIRVGDGRVRVRGVNVTGDFGNFELGGAMDADGKGTYRLSCHWPQPPTTLLDALTMSAEQHDSLRARWNDDGPFSVKVSGRVTRDSRGVSTRAEGTFELPGPATLTTLFAPGSRVDDLGSVRGVFDADVAQNSSGLDYRAALDFTGTDWIDSSAVAIQGSSGRIELGPAYLAFEDLHVDVNGTREAGVWDATGNMNLTSSRWIARFMPADSLSATARASMHVTGTMSAPTVDASVVATLQRPGLEIPTVEADIRSDTQAVRAQLRLADGLSTNFARLSFLVVDYESIDNASVPFPGRLRVDAEGDEISYLHRLQIDSRNDAWAIATDSLAVVVRGLDLRNIGASRFRYAADTQTLSFDNVRLSGSIGRVYANGYAGPDSADLDAEVTLVLPPLPPSIRFDPNLWPERVDTRITVRSDNRVQIQSDVVGITLADRSRPAIQIGIDGDADSVLIRAGLNLESTSLGTATLRLPARVQVFPPRLYFDEGVLDLDASIKDLPVAASQQQGGRVARLSGDAQLAGTSRHPSGRLKGRMTFPQWPKLSAYDVTFDVSASGARDGVDPDARTTRGSDNDTTQVNAEPMTVARDVTSRILLHKSGKKLADAELTYPVSWSIYPASFVKLDEQAMRLRLRTGQLLLTEFDALLPPDVGLEGTLLLDFDATGIARDPTLRGRLSVRDFKVALAEGSTVSGRGDIELRGTASEPSLEGGIDIQRGVIRIPEPPKNLHPAEGSAVVSDSLAVRHQPRTEPANRQSSKQPPRRFELSKGSVDIAVRIPSGLWLRGQGLDVELAGDLRLTQKGAGPTINGELQALRGHLVFLGRTFLVERGNVTFYGADEIDPALDIVLVARIEGTVVRISFGGTAQKPELVLSSEPEMPEADIMSFLLFGRPTEDLNHDQMDLLQRRASDLVTSFGLAQLEARLSRQLGVDMVRIRKASGDDDRQALVLGKYISRRVLVTYEQVLEDQTSFLLNLEYFLGRNFKIETLVGRQSQSGIEIDWTKDY